MTRRSRASRIVSSRELWTFRTYQTSSGGGSSSSSTAGDAGGGGGGGRLGGIAGDRGRGVRRLGLAAVGRLLLDLDPGGFGGGLRLGARPDRSAPAGGPRSTRGWIGSWMTSRRGHASRIQETEDRRTHLRRHPGGGYAVVRPSARDSRALRMVQAAVPAAARRRAGAPSSGRRAESAAAAEPEHADHLEQDATRASRPRRGRRPSGPRSSAPPSSPGIRSSLAGPRDLVHLGFGGDQELDERRDTGRAGR